jgi:hypothetical protein
VRGPNPSSRFDFGPVVISLHRSRAISSLIFQLYGGTAYVLGGLEGVVAMSNKTVVASWIQFDIPQQKRVKLCAGMILQIGSYEVMLGGFSRTSNSDTIVYCVAHPGKVKFDTFGGIEHAFRLPAIMCSKWKAGHLPTPFTLTKSEFWKHRTGHAPQRNNSWNNISSVTKFVLQSLASIPSVCDLIFWLR